jgi:hypothetical protein
VLISVWKGPDQLLAVWIAVVVGLIVFIETWKRVYSLAENRFLIKKGVNS